MMASIHLILAHQPRLLLQNVVVMSAAYGARLGLQFANLKDDKVQYFMTSIRHN